MYTAIHDEISSWYNTMYVVILCSSLWVIRSVIVHHIPLKFINVYIYGKMWIFSFLIIHWKFQFWTFHLYSNWICTVWWIMIEVFICTTRWCCTNCSQNLTEIFKSLTWLPIWNILFLLPSSVTQTPLLTRLWLSHMTIML